LSPLSLCDQAFFNVDYKNVQVIACIGIQCIMEENKCIFYN